VFFARDKFSFVLTEIKIFTPSLQTKYSYMSSAMLLFPGMGGMGGKGGMGGTEGKTGISKYCMFFH